LWFCFLLFLFWTKFVVFLRENSLKTLSFIFQFDSSTMMKERKKQQKKKLQFCFGGVHCLKLEDKKHLSQFKHFEPVHFSFILHWFISFVILFLSLFSFLSCQLIDLFDWIFTQINTTQRNFSESIEQCEISKNPTLNLTLERNSKENEIPNSISTLTHLHTFKLFKPRILFGLRQKINVNLNSITSLHNQIQTCIIQKVQLTPNLNDKSNPIYTLTKLQHLELIEWINELNEIISKLTSLQNLLLSNNHELNRLPSSMTKLKAMPRPLVSNYLWDFIINYMYHYLTHWVFTWNYNSDNCSFQWRSETLNKSYWGVFSLQNFVSTIKFFSHWHTCPPILSLIILILYYFECCRFFFYC
jgi:hypothetical protein